MISLAQAALDAMSSWAQESHEARESIAWAATRDAHAGKHAMMTEPVRAASRPSALVTIAHAHAEAPR